MAEHDPRKGEDFVKKMQLDAMQVSLDAREQKEGELLEELKTLFDQIDSLIPQLPPLAGDPVTEEERAVQTAIKEKFTEFNRIGRLFLYEESEVTPENKFDASFDLSSNRNTTLRALHEAGRLTEAQVVDWHVRNADRAEKFAEFYQQWAEIMGAHGEQLFRV